MKTLVVFHCRKILEKKNEAFFQKMKQVLNPPTVSKLGSQTHEHS